MSGGTKIAETNKAKQAKSRYRRNMTHPMQALLGEQDVINAAGETISPKNIASKDGILGLYFSARWCGPCRRFTPRLKVLYEELKNKEQVFEVVYISFDHGPDAFHEYLDKMPWWAVPFDQEDKREEIADKFGISGLPCLLLLDGVTLEVISASGTDIVLADPRGDHFPWTEMPDLQDMKRTLKAAMQVEEEKRALEAEEEAKQAETAVDIDHMDPLPENGHNSSSNISGKSGGKRSNESKRSKEDLGRSAGKPTNENKRSSEQFKSTAKPTNESKRSSAASTKAGSKPTNESRRSSAQFKTGGKPPKESKQSKNEFGKSGNKNTL